MSAEPMQAVLRYRLEQAEQTLEEASVLADASFLRGAVNRAYYGHVLRSTRPFGNPAVRNFKTQQCVGSL